MPAYHNVINLIKDCLYAIEEQENTGIDASAQKITMFAFYTDGGTHDDSWTYFVHRVFEMSNYLYSTRNIVDPVKNPVHI